MIITRTEAIVLSSFVKMLNLDDTEAATLTERALAEFGKSVKKQEQRNRYLRRYLSLKFSCYTNQYIKTFLKKQFDIELEITGVQVELYICPCCGYKTLEKKSEYFICAVCFWEDDGTTEDGKYSNVNRMTLNDAKTNFLKLGAVTESSLEFLDVDRFIQYDK